MTAGSDTWRGLVTSVRVGSVQWWSERLDLREWWRKK